MEEDVSEPSKKRKDGPAQVVESTVNRNVKQKVAVSKDGAAAAARMKDLVEKDGDGKVTASSMQRLLVQALHTNDKASLEYCFQVCDEDIIGNTVDRIPPSFVMVCRYQVPRLTPLETVGTHHYAHGTQTIPFHSAPSLAE